jgi:hypothetical protein
MSRQDPQKPADNLNDKLPPSVKDAVICLAVRPSCDAADADRLGPGTVQQLIERGLLGDDGFITDLGISVGWACKDDAASLPSVEMSAGDDTAGTSSDHVAGTPPPERTT